MKDATDVVAAACTHCTHASHEELAQIGRRDFLSASALATLGVLLAACGGSDNPTAPTTITPVTITLSNYPALATVGGVANVSASGTSVAVVRTSDTTFAAFSRVCPHEGGTVSATGGQFVCAKHGARFALTTGTWVGGQPTTNLRSYTTSFDATAGTVTIGS